MVALKDFIYLDMNKVSSLYSQLLGGVVQSTETSSSTTSTNRNLRHYNLKVFKHDAGGNEASSDQIKETRVSHHEIYNELESTLIENGFVTQLGKDLSKDDLETGRALEVLENTLCIKVEGHTVFEDYVRLTRISDRYHDIANFLNEGRKSSLRETAEYKELIGELASLKTTVQQLKSGPEKKIKTKAMRELETRLEAALNSNNIATVEKWIIEGLKTFVEVFIPRIFNVRLYPFGEQSPFHVMSSVKREAFLEPDTEELHYLFGSRPTLKLTMLAVVTSVPRNEGDEFNPLHEFEALEEDLEENNSKTFERAFRGVFRGFDGFEEMIRTCRFPRIMVQPISIYRSVAPANK